MNQHSMPSDVRWIGTDRRQCEGFPIETAYFKTVFKADHLTGPFNIHISANTRYCLYVNGAVALNGPCKGDNWHQYCDVVDIASYLGAGSNIVAVKVTAFPPFEASYDDRSNFGPVWSMSNSAGPTLIVWGECKAADISTGRTAWYCRNDDAIGWHIQRDVAWVGCTEDVDGAKLPVGWNTSVEIGEGFSPAVPKWNNTVSFGEIPTFFLYDRPIPQLLRQEHSGLSELSHPDGYSLDTGAVTLPSHGKYEFILDAGRLTTSFVFLRCVSGAGSRVELLYSEGYEKIGPNGHYKENRSDASGTLTGVTDVYHPGGRDETYSPSWFRTFRFIKISIETGAEELCLYPLQLTETRYPFENKVKFEADLPWVRQVWDLSQRTLELCMHETFEDCPFYEQLQYTMDTRLQMLYSYAAGGDTALQRKAINDFHTSLLPEGILQSRFPSKYPQVIPIFSLHWIFMLRDYYCQTGELELVRRYKPTMEAILDWFKRKTGPQGLVEKLGYWDFADWTDEWEDIAGASRASQNGMPSTINNLVYACALDCAAFLMDELGYGQTSGFYRSEKMGVMASAERFCYSEKRGLFMEGPGFGEYSQHAQIWAVLSGLAGGEAARRLMQTVLDDHSLIKCSFVMQYYLFRALEKAGMYEQTERLWKLWSDLPDLDLTTVPEIPGPKTRSDCHAWGALIMHELPRKFLGVQPLEPGFAKVLIRPMGLYLGGVSGEVPTPRGPVSVKWRAESGKFTLEGSTPVEAEIHLPDGTVRTAGPGEFAFTSGC